MLTLLLTVVVLLVAVLGGLFGLGIDVDLPDGTSLDNASTLDALTALFQSSVDTILSSDIVGYIAYFFPLSGLYLLTEVFFTCVVVYTVVANLYPIIRDWLIARSS